MAATKKIRIFIECTQTFFKGGNSGIQRVVRNLANNGRGIAMEDVEVYPIVWAKIGFCRPRARLQVKAHFLVRIRVRLADVKAKSIDVVSKCIPAFLKKTIRFIVKGLKGRRKLSRDLSLPLKALLYVPFRFLFGELVAFRPGDVVVLVDSTWKAPLMLDALGKEQQEQGLVVGVMIHDLFPLLMPENCEEVTVEGFSAWFKRVVPLVDFFIANSRATMQALAEYLGSHPELKAKPFTAGSFRLGAELDCAGEAIKNPEHLQPIWDTLGRAILAIGTIEPRKNYVYLLDAYDILRKKNVDVSLIIVGRPGWKCADVVQRINVHPDYETRLLHLENASDRDLAEAIERADCLVCPSLAEGFGLPVVEGLMRGLPVFASDIPVFHESGDGWCRFFDLSSPESLAGLLENWFADPAVAGRPTTSKPFSWPDWKESSKEFLSLVLRLAAAARAAQIKE